MPDRVRVILKCDEDGDGGVGVVVGVSGVESGIDDLVGVEANVREMLNREIGRKKVEIGN